MLPRRISVSLFIDQSIIWPVKRLQAFKFQLRPGGQQEREMRRFAGACRLTLRDAAVRVFLFHHPLQPGFALRVQHFTAVQAVGDGDAVFLILIRVA